jgi:very-short-patch-repair endonuclease
MRRTLITSRARAMRKTMTEPELMLWSRLRGREPGEPTFRRQHPFGPLMLDVYCPAARLAVEVDGSIRWDEAAQAKDKARDGWLMSQGVQAPRILAPRVVRDLGGVTDGIRIQSEELIAAERARRRLAPSTTRPSAGGPPPAASRGRQLRRAASSAHPNGLSMDGGGSEKNFGPFSVMWKQSSSRTPNSPGM